ncbi:MAG TPA: hypothetical protein VF283_15515 [Bryobacteraceae bacterium]
MKVLLDHNVPHKLRTSLLLLCKHEIVTASYMKWGEFKNGELLRMAEADGFQVFVTGDQTHVFGAEPRQTAVGDCRSLNQQLAHPQKAHLASSRCN